MTQLSKELTAMRSLKTLWFYCKSIHRKEVYDETTQTNQTSTSDRTFVPAAITLTSVDRQLLEDIFRANDKLESLSLESMELELQECEAFLGAIRSSVPNGKDFTLILALTVRAR